MRGQYRLWALVVSLATTLNPPAQMQQLYGLRFNP